MHGSSVSIFLFTQLGARTATVVRRRTSRTIRACDASIDNSDRHTGSHSPPQHESHHAPDSSSPHLSGPLLTHFQAPFGSNQGPPSLPSPNHGKFRFWLLPPSRYWCSYPLHARRPCCRGPDSRPPGSSQCFGKTGHGIHDGRFRMTRSRSSETIWRSVRTKRKHGVEY